MERLGKFENLEVKLQDKLTITQSEQSEILVKLKRLQNKISSVTIDITGMKYVKEKLENYNELLDEASKHQTNLNETLCRDNSEVLRVKKDLEKIIYQLCTEKIPVTSNNKEISQRCKYSEEIETSKDQLQIRIDSPSTNIETTWCQENQVNVVLKV